MVNSSHGEDNAQAELRTSCCKENGRNSQSSGVKRTQETMGRDFCWPKMRYSENSNINYCEVFKHIKYTEILSP